MGQFDAQQVAVKVKKAEIKAGKQKETTIFKEKLGGLKCCVYFDSSLLLSLAAVSAAIISPSKSFALKTFMAASVVPPGDVTRCLS